MILTRNFIVKSSSLPFVEGFFIDSYVKTLTICGVQEITRFVNVTAFIPSMALEQRGRA
jgi:hypothetical protein